MLSESIDIVEVEYLWPEYFMCQLQRHRWNYTPIYYVSDDSAISAYNPYEMVKRGGLT